jgi:hypothetical protein
MMNRYRSAALRNHVKLMLTTAAGEKDYRRTWARVNRAAGMIAGAVAAGIEDPETAGASATELVMAPLRDSWRHPVPARRKMLLEGLEARVARALYEWYTGSCPEEEGR